MSNPEQEKAFVISPHQDDAVLSLGAYLKSRYDNVSVLNLFTQSSAHMLEGVEDDPEVISRIRHDEDAAVARSYGFRFTDAGFRDAELRGVAWNDALAPVDQDLLDQVASSINEHAFHKEDGTGDVFVPAAFGLHPDHYLGLLASLRAFGGRDLYVYGDQPYYLEPHSTQHDALDMLRKERGERVPFAVQDKESMLALYPSQLTVPRVKRLGAVAHEFIWRLGPDDTAAMSEKVTNRRAVSVVPFGDVRWIDSVKEVYQSDTRTPIVAPVENTEGVPISIPIMLDTQDIPDVGPVVFGRHTGVYGADYLDFEGMRQSDGNSLHQLKQALRQNGARYMWISNMRETDGYARLLEFLPEERAETFEGIPSLVTNCNSDGFDTWLSKLNSMQRKKYRQVERKREALEAQHGVMAFSIEEGTRENLEDFLTLQAQRANSASLDAFLEDEEYTRFLERVTEEGLVSFANVYVADKKISTLIILDDTANKSIAILGQGFDNEWAYYSPSYINMYNLIQHAHDKGYETVDFLRGDEYYKTYFTNQTQRLYKHLEALEEVSDDEWQKVIAFVKAYEE